MQRHGDASGGLLRNRLGHSQLCLNRGRRRPLHGEPRASAADANRGKRRGRAAKRHCQHAPSPAAVVLWPSVGANHLWRGGEHISGAARRDGLLHRDELLFRVPTTELGRWIDGYQLAGLLHGHRCDVTVTD